MPADTALDPRELRPALKTLATRALDRPRLRPALAALVKAQARRRHATSVQVDYDSAGYWVVHWPTAKVPGPTPSLALTPAEQEESARDVFLQEYTPSAGDVIVDVGAGVGWELSLWSRSVGSSGRVIAIEADPNTFRWLELRRRLNELSNVTALQLAIVDEPGEIRIETQGHHESHAITTDKTGNAVRATTLDLVAEQEGLQQIDFLKMNIEGAERLALLGMSGVAERVRHMAVGCHDFLADRGGDPATRTEAFVSQWMSEQGFRVTPRRPDDRREAARSWLYGTRD